MRPAILVSCWVLVAAAAHAATITGTVVGEGMRPVAGALVEVVRPAGSPSCQTRTAADGTFSFTCAANGPHAVRASFADLTPWQADAVLLAPDSEVHLNFVLMPAGIHIDVPTPPDDPPGFWTRPVPNPVLGTWRDHPVTLRALAIVVAPVAFVLGALTMLALGRRFGVETRRLSPDEVGDMVMNPHMTVGPRTIPVATVGARGAEASISYDSDKIGAALADRRYGLVLAALVVAPGWFALATLGMALAMLIGQETWLLCAMLLVPAGFVLTPIIIGMQALGRRTQH